MRFRHAFTTGRRSVQRRGVSHSAHSNNNQNSPANNSFRARLRSRLRATPVRWSPLPVGVGIALLLALHIAHRLADAPSPEPASIAGGPAVSLSGPWQVHVIGALPLRSLSRIYGAVNSYTLPVWFRVPGYRLYASIFGVNLDECDPEDLTQYRSLAEFFTRKLKPGLRPIAETLVVSPADGTIVNFGVIENRRVPQVKGRTYSLDALLGGPGALSALDVYRTEKPQSHVDEEAFANVNGIEYSLDDLLGDDSQMRGHHPKADTSSTSSPSSSSSSSSSPDTAKRPDVDASVDDGPAQSILEQAQVASQVFPSWGMNHVPRPGNKMYFSVIYLAPGDYHRFHSPTNWVVERRRHFAGELFSVSPWMARKLADLFVVNERVALLGRFRHGFFSLTAVGATNVGSIIVNFDKALRTNAPNRGHMTPGTFAEATYAGASRLLGGQPVRAGDEMGGFMLGSTVVLVFEAPENFEFRVTPGQKIQVGEELGDFSE